MFPKKDWARFLEIGQTVSSFDWDIPLGYILFGVYGMSVHKKIHGQWMHKSINDWRRKTHIQVNAELKTMKWEGV